MLSVYTIHRPAIPKALCLQRGGVPSDFDHLPTTCTTMTWTHGHSTGTITTSRPSLPPVLQHLAHFINPHSLAHSSFLHSSSLSSRSSPTSILWLAMARLRPRKMRANSGPSADLRRCRAPGPAPARSSPSMMLPSVTAAPGREAEANGVAAWAWCVLWALGDASALPLLVVAAAVMVHTSSGVRVLAAASRPVSMSCTCPMAWPLSVWLSG
mmetsp:Transcript_27038/g.68746  ORF Transcript_27038/g.68746 Transcript_27038/m.68746 type:complete len:212 (-) Transcript_27038:319-954(-)